MTPDTLTLSRSKVLRWMADSIQLALDQCLWFAERERFFEAKERFEYAKEAMTLYCQYNPPQDRQEHLTQETCRVSQILQIVWPS